MNRSFAPPARLAGRRWGVLIALAFGACTGKGDDTAHQGDDTGTQPDDTGVAGDCSVTASAELSTEMPTFAHVTWTAPADAAITVEASTEGLASRSYALPSGGSGTVPFLDASHDWTLRVRATLPSQSCVSEDLAVRTPPASSLLPGLIPSQAADADTVPLLATTLGGAQGAAVLLDPAGDYVWWTTINPGENYDRVRVSADGTGVWVLKKTANIDEIPLLLHFPWEGASDESIAIANGHHDFVELNLDGDRMAWLAADHRTIDGERVVGDTIHILGDDGVEREIWNAFDHFEVVENVGWTESVYPGEADWTHANTLVYVPDLDAFLISLHFIPAVVLVDRATGNQEWVFGTGPGVDSSFSFADGAPGQMHSPSITDRGLMLFENGDTETRRSTVTEFDVDWTARTASRGWTAAPSADSYAYVLGDARRLPNGRTITTWGSLGVAEEFDASANPTWKMNLPMGASFGFLDLPTPPWTNLDDE